MIFIPPSFILSKLPILLYFIIEGKTLNLKVMDLIWTQI